MEFISFLNVNNVGVFYINRLKIKAYGIHIATMRML